MPATKQTTRLIDQIKGQPSRKYEKCAVTKLKESMNPEDAEDLESALQDRSIACTVIWRVLSNNGHEIGVGSLNRHRNQQCKCKEAARGV